jgi:hypothetical protein
MKLITFIYSACCLILNCSAEVTRGDAPEKKWYDNIVFTDWFQQNEKDMDVWLLRASGRIPRYQFEHLSEDTRANWIKLLSGAEFKELGADFLLIDFDDDYLKEKENLYGFIVIKQKDGKYIGFNKGLGMCNQNALQPIFVQEFDGENKKLHWSSRMDLKGLMLKCDSEKLFELKK